MAWRIIADLIPEIGTAKLLATSDDEFTELLKKFIKKGFVMKCELHASKKIERWVTDHGGRKKEECHVLKSDFRYIVKIIMFGIIFSHFGFGKFYYLDEIK